MFEGPGTVLAADGKKRGGREEVYWKALSPKHFICSYGWKNGSYCWSHLLMFISPPNLLLGKSRHAYGVREKWGWRGERYKDFTELALRGQFRFVLEAEKRNFTCWNRKFPAVCRWRRALESKYEALRLRKVSYIFNHEHLIMGHLRFLCIMEHQKWRITS